MKEEGPHLLQLWRQAMAMKNSSEWESAARLLVQILQLRADWEHGYGFFNLAECYEELQRIDEARVAYERAAASAPTDATLLGALASFLYLHGDPRQAFDQYLRLLLLERKRGDASGAAATMTALMSLGSRLGWSELATRRRVAEACEALS